MSRISEAKEIREKMKSLYYRYRTKAFIVAWGPKSSTHSTPGWRVIRRGESGKFAWLWGMDSGWRWLGTYTGDTTVGELLEDLQAWYETSGEKQGEVE